MEPACLTLQMFAVNGIAVLKRIALMPGFEWVGLMPLNHIHDDTLQLICNLVNAATGAKPPPPPPATGVTGSGIATPGPV